MTRKTTIPKAPAAKRGTRAVQSINAAAVSRELESIRQTIASAIGHRPPTEPWPVSGNLSPAGAPAPLTAVEMALDENTGAMGRLHDALSVLGDRLERTVLPTAPPQTTGDAASPSFGASPVLHRLTSLHAGIEGAASRVHSILGRLEA